MSEIDLARVVTLKGDLVNKSLQWLVYQNPLEIVIHHVTQWHGHFNR